jgi:SRSO17 transposase
MELSELRKLRDKLYRFVGAFDDCIKTAPSRRHLRTYVRGQLGPLQRKNVETMALAAGVRVRTLQEFLSLHRWDEAAVGRRVRERIRTRHAHPHAIAVIDETSFAKCGRKTAGVKRQYCGATGKIDNCVVSVHLGYVADEFHALLDGELYVPEDWATDPDRCAEAGIPPTVGYRPKWRIALDLLRRALDEGLELEWLTADELYGRGGEFRATVARWGLRYVVEIPQDVQGWVQSPALEHPGTDAGTGRPRTRTRLAPDAPKARKVNALWQRGGPNWQLYRIKDTDKGPAIWRVRETRFHAWTNGLPGPAERLVIAHNVLEDEVKYFLTNAPAEIPLKDVLRVAFARAHIEALFREGKGAVGMADFQVRHYRALQRHLVLTAVSLLFLAEQTRILRGGKPVVVDLPGARGDRGTAGPPVVPTRADATADVRAGADLLPAAPRG